MISARIPEESSSESPEASPGESIGEKREEIPGRTPGEALESLSSLLARQQMHQMR